MKAVLEFNLPQEDSEFNFAKNGFQYSRVITKALEKLNEKIEYLDKSVFSQDFVEVRDFIIKEIESRNLTLE